jgi:hypothetical protein
MLSKNVNPKIVSEMLGHATIAITLDTYSHVLPTMQESAAIGLSFSMCKAPPAVGSEYAAHLYPAPQDAVTALGYWTGAERQFWSHRIGLCRIVDLDFRELIFF